MHITTIAGPPASLVPGGISSTNVNWPLSDLCETQIEKNHSSLNQFIMGYKPISFMGY
jgi:hypothetical protein